MKKQISGGIILSFLSQIISIVVGLLYTPILIRALGQNEYGLYQLVLSVVNYLNLMNFGFNGAYIRYYAIANKKNDEEEVANVNGMFLKIFLFIALMCLAVGGILLFNIGFLGNQLTSSDYLIAKKLLAIMVVNLAISFPNSLYVAYMSANERFIYQKILNIVFNVAIPILNIPLLYFGLGSVGIVSITLFLTILRLFANIWYCYSKLNIKINFSFFDDKIFKELLGYTFFIFLSDVVDQMNSNVDKFLLGRIIGTIPVAIYSVGYNLKNYYVTISWSVPEMYIPEVNKLAVVENSDEKLTDLFIKVGKINNYLVLLVLSGFYLLGHQFVILWVGKEYDLSYYSALILMVAAYIPAIQTLGVNIQTAKNMHRIRSIIYFFVACINIVASYFLIKLYGVIGTCIGTLFAVLIGNGFFMNYIYYKKINLNIFKFWKEIAKWLVPVIVLTLFTKTILNYILINSWIKLFIFGIIYSFVYMVLLFVFELNEEQKVNIRKKLLFKEK